MEELPFNKEKKENIPKVFIEFNPYDNMQKFIEAEDENGEIFVISFPYGTHKDILDSYNNKNQKKLKCIGGGFFYRLNSDDGGKEKLKVFGKSQVFGYFNSERVIGLLKRELPEFDVFFDPYS